MALKITMSKSGAAAKKYFAEHLRRSDYLSQNGARPGIWVGRGAERLGLEGEVAAKDFVALASNKDPNTGKRLTVRDVRNARPGYDFTFSGPKSFAAVWARTGDERLIEALRDSILDTIREDIEPEMKTRLRRAGQDGDVVTGNLAGSLFMHDTTRPLKEDNKPDPHPHGHAYLFNRTWAAHEKRWQAAQLGDLHLDRPYFEAACRGATGARLRQMGFVLESDGKGSWEIVGVPESVNVKFSRRRYQEILPEAERLGITDGAGRATLGKRTRQDKIKGETLATPELHGYWHGKLTGDEAAALDEVVARAAGGSTGGRIRVTAEQAVRHSLEHFFGPDGRNSAESEKAVLEEALRYAAGAVLPEEAKKELARQDLIRAVIGGRMICTTEEVHTEELALKKSAWSGRHANLPLSVDRPYLPTAAVAAARRQDRKLDLEQAEAVRHMLDSKDRAQLFIGRAGTAKTTTLQELDRALRERGRRIMAFAPTARASRGVLRNKGFATADTLANLLDKPALQQQVRGQIIILDEAGMAGTRATRRLFDLVEWQQAEGYDTRLILTGDPQQLRGVPRGQVLTILEEQAGLVPARLTTIRRQEDPRYRHAVELLSTGRAGEAFDLLDQELGFIREIADPEERYRELAKDYADSYAAGDSEMIISPTHAEGRVVAAAVRQELKARELLGAEDHTLVRLENKDSSIARRKDAAQYEDGDAIQWNQNAPGGFVRGDRVDGGRPRGQPRPGRGQARPGQGAALGPGRALRAVPHHKPARRRRRTAARDA